jgi:hypothetical protein
LSRRRYQSLRCLRLGQAQFERNEKERAKDPLMRAYMAAGEEIFKTEDPKYLAFVRTFAKRPPPRWLKWLLGWSLSRTSRARFLRSEA